MGHKHSRDALLDAARRVARTQGLHRLTFGRVATEASVSDRIVVYYFPDKPTLIESVLEAEGSALQSGLAEALGDRQYDDHRDVVARAWSVTRTPDGKGAAAIYIEALGLAAAGVDPYTRVAEAVAIGWIAWLETSFAGTAQHRREQALAAITVLDGLMMIRAAAGLELADLAARTLVGPWE